jgi:PII-like signaling protein
MTERRHGFMDALQAAGLYHEELVKQVDFLQLDTDIPEAVASLDREWNRRTIVRCKYHIFQKRSCTFEERKICTRTSESCWF